MKRKLTAVLLSLALALALLPATALAAGTAYPATGGNIYIDSGVLADADEGITAVHIPSSVTIIDAWVFEDCENLTDVYYSGSEVQWAELLAANFVGDAEGAAELVADVTASGELELFLKECYAAMGMDPDTITMHYNSSAPVAPQQPQAPASDFSDVAAGAYYYEPVLWAVEKGVTTGRTKTTFVPNDPCSVGNILTFLWRAYGEPAATIENPFSDVTEENYYYGAALWAAEKGIVDAGGTFGANDPCTRAMAVAYMWKAAGSPEAQPAAFTDVEADAEYAAAVAWAVAKEITSGYEDNTFRPGNGCSRGNIVTFLWRALAD